LQAHDFHESRDGGARPADTIGAVTFATMSLRLKINLIVAALSLLFAATVLAFLQGMGRVRSNDITLYDAQGREL
jgi:hypothetical protein